ncbi:MULTISPECIES: DEAD/DEAH box helicase [Methylobacter]|jgi:ATP-dependent RNA helicase DeaD|uniref:ATP-dependent RNA helicase DeaD n=2 Tax=Methylobacter tundripaludum TaxID=173365 RepID=G3IYC2_METTV|nr:MULTISPECIES: DEAD/DEAH box helicase [Methylobacter]EGW20044.1 DEAD/DEAH box helicase domain protein [Methylobacter tundripaludum SV96]MDI1276392.1 DEAD/DEAH box helicase [Methylobacter sp.]MDI1357178.1 DEAD/DEAH box helicase [Methylobacter sp.]PPK75405.1 ATP-dependent RNA helicase CsdA [Methylobacter tundripaludum]
MSNDVSTLPSFSDLALIEPVLRALKDVGYETPSPIQAQTIPLLLQGKDVLGQAQTGTGKTAAFALPILSRIDLKQKDPQVLVLAPTRELAIQVAEAFQRYAAHLKGFHVLPIYGGQDYTTQLRQLKRGAHVVVGTPGRVMDHMRKGTLNLKGLGFLVLDEADEMLRMGFIDDVEWILDQIPEKRQIALFSATMPSVIRKIAQQYLNEPEHITIKVTTASAENIRQRYWLVSGVHKLDALTRILEAETFDGMIIFVRTKTSTVELAEKLEARGYSAAAINGDMSQALRERAIANLKNGKLDILIATDVAARGLDVDRITHVVNYDIPYDTESYVHRIGRTGRAGRTGDAILFIAPRERNLLANIEKATKQKVEEMGLPSTEVINNKRISRFKQNITDTLAAEELSFFSQLLEQYQQEHNVTALEIASALAKLVQGETPLLLQNLPKKSKDSRDDRPSRDDRSARPDRPQKDRKPKRAFGGGADIEMETYRIEVGHTHGVKPGNIVGAIANETGIDGDHIARIRIQDDYSTVELPAGIPKELFEELKKVRVAGQQLNISKMSEGAKKAAKDDDSAKKVDKSKKRVGSPSRRAKPKAAE